MISTIFRGGVDDFSYFQRGCRWFQLFLERMQMVSAILRGVQMVSAILRGGVDGFSYSQRRCRWFQLFLEGVQMVSVILRGVDGFSYFQRGCRWLQLFVLDFQSFYFLTRIFLDHNTFNLTTHITPFIYMLIFCNQFFVIDVRVPSQESEW